MDAAKEGFLEARQEERTGLQCPPWMVRATCQTRGMPDHVQGLPWKCKIIEALWNTSLGVSNKTKHRLSYGPAVSLVDIYSREMIPSIQILMHA